MELYLPNRYDTTPFPLIFLGGPIEGAPRWQNPAWNFLSKETRPANVASPRYIGEDEQQAGNWTPNITGEQQIDWEIYHMNKAGFGLTESGKGAVLFWLAREKTHNCARAYAQTSRIEVGEWVQKHIFTGCNVVIGIEDGFSGEGYIRYRVSRECPKIPIESDLEKACERALELIFS